MSGRRDDDPDGAGQLRAKALAMLARREHSRLELEWKLRRAGGDRDAVRDVLSELEASGLLSDHRFAESTVRQKQGRFSRRYIAESLKARGVDLALATEALGTLAGDERTAVALWKRRFGAPPDGEREKARQVRFLLARGFSTAVALRVVTGTAAAESED